MKTFILSVISILLFTSFIYPQTFQWQQLNGPFGGTALSFVTNSNGDVFAGADQDQRGIFRSTDEGLTFQPKSAGLYLTNRAFSWLVVDDSSYIIAGTNSHIGSKVYKSKDNGESWTEIANLGGKNVTVNDSGHIYVGDTGYAQYSVSRDGGYTWTHYASPSGFTYCITFNDSGHIFIGGNYTGYRSTDNGASWTSLGPMGLPSGVKSIAVDTNGNLYAGCYRESSTNSGVFRSADNGNSWTPVKQGFLVNSSNNIVINNVGDIIVGSYGWGIWKSSDEGLTWTQQNTGLGHLYIVAMHISVNGYVYAGTSGGGIYRSTDDCETWQQVGLTTAGVNRLAISPLNGDLFAAVGGMSRSTDSGVTWEPINTGITYFDIRKIAIKLDGTIFIGLGVNYANPSYFIYRSTDNGDNWVPSQTGVQTHEIAGLTIDDSGNVYVINYYGLYKSTNNGDSWFKIGDLSGGNLAINSAGDIFVTRNGGVYRKLANDTVWTNCIGASSGSPPVIFIANNGYIYTDYTKSTDNGDTWTTNNFPTFISSYAENSLGHLFIGTYNYGQGVYRSTNYAETWEQINTGLPIMDIRSVGIDDQDYLYAGSWGMSMFKTTTSTLVSVEDIEFKPATFYLDQNYPNPFNPSTVISYQIPVGGDVTLKIYDILGNEVAKLVDEYKPAGKYKVEFNVAQVSRPEIASGVYFYQLRYGEYINTRKMILIK